MGPTGCVPLFPKFGNEVPETLNHLCEQEFRIASLGGPLSFQSFFRFSVFSLLKSDKFLLENKAVWFKG